MNNLIFSPQDLDQIADAILCKIQQNAKAIGMITNSGAIHLNHKILKDMAIIIIFGLLGVILNGDLLKIGGRGMRK